MVRYRLEPSAQLLENNQWRWIEGTVADAEGYDLLRPYHQLSVDMRPCARFVRQFLRFKLAE